MDVTDRHQLIEGTVDAPPSDQLTLTQRSSEERADRVMTRDASTHSAEAGVSILYVQSSCSHGSSPAEGRVLLTSLGGRKLEAPRVTTATLSCCRSTLVSGQRQHKGGQVRARSDVKMSSA